MTFPLTSADASAVVRRMLAAEVEQDSADALAKAGRPPGSPFPAELDAATLAEIFRDTDLSMSSDGGELLYRLARRTRARTIVEFGTSSGLSTIYLASAVQDNGGGTVIGTELHAGKAAAAQRNLGEAGVAGLVDLRIGDARDTLAEGREQIDLLVLDGWPHLALPVMNIVESRLHRGSVVVIDGVDVDWGADLHGPVLAHLVEQSDRYLSVKLGVRDGIQMFFRVA